MGEHFNMPGHSLSNMIVTVLEKVKTIDEMYRKEREKYFIMKFNTYYKGLNRQPQIGGDKDGEVLVIYYIVNYYLIN